MNAMADAARMARMARAQGFEEIVVGFVYSLSPIHTDGYYAECARRIEEASQGAIDALYIKDPGGLLTPERLASLVPAIRSRLARLEIHEIHTHCNTGLAPRVLLDAADMGIAGLHCALDPVANGASHAPAAMLVKNLRARGHEVAIDDEKLMEACRVIEEIARDHGLPLGAPAVYDESYFQHQIPGGVLSTMERQLREIGQLHLLPAVKDEVIRVRADLGFPIMVTPFSQYLVTQATMNVLTGRRYEQIPDEIVPMLCGDFGELPGTVDPEILERAQARRRVMAVEEESIPQLRMRLGAHLSDEELLLRALMPQEQVDAIVDAPSDFVAKVIAGLNAGDGRDVDIAVGASRFSLTR
jgi:oxaloacetate decarboxylase alpha subunit